MKNNLNSRTSHFFITILFFFFFSPTYRYIIYLIQRPGFSVKKISRELHADRQGSRTGNSCTIIRDYDAGDLPNSANDMIINIFFRFFFFEKKNDTRKKKKKERVEGWNITTSPSPSRSSNLKSSCPPLRVPPPPHTSWLQTALW